MYYSIHRHPFQNESFSASYLPHGMDAAVGNDEQNLRLRNGYAFPLRIEAFSVGDGALTVCVYAGE
ncbi:MAG: VanW family protein [Eubacteriales bacterium]|nr:VanW family protein [Eubacteriales bacterium]